MKIYDVFISYRRSDGQTKAEALYRYLTERGLRVFLDKHEMVDGHYFTAQIEKQLRTVPNYVLVATDDVFRFRQGEDWVRTEMQIALQMYEQAPEDRSIVVLTEEQVQFPLKEALPAEVCKIADVQRVVLGDAQEADFERIFHAVTQVNHQNLWRAAHRWLENSKRPGGRFAKLSIVESILPSAGQAPSLRDIPVNISDAPKNGHTKALFDAVGETRSHLFLIGQGGIGKTTALMHLMNETYVERPYNRNAQIPIFVELSFAPDVYDTLYEDGRSSFIRRSIYKQLRTDRTVQQVTEEEVSDIDEAFMLPYKVAVEPINDILSRTSPAPEYLLLLDGLNEVSTAFMEQANATVTKMIAEEINMLMTNCPNVRVVLTSRSDEISVSDQPMERFYLSGVDEDTICAYLQERKIPGIDRIMRNRSLVQTLKTPLFLTLYGSLASREEVSTQGEIFRLFFHERSKNISIYTVQDRLLELERNIYDTAGLNQRNRLTAPMQWFILDFLLPEIAWHMEREGQFYLRPNQIAKIIRPVLEDRSDIAVCGDFGKDLFVKYQQGSAADIHTQSVAEDILRRLGPDISKCTEKIINCCTMALGILQCSGRKYGFVHQHIRDYFAALKNINTMRLALFLQEEQERELALECINTVFRDAPVGLSVRQFMGQTLGEHHNRPVYRGGVYHDAVDTSKEDCTLLSRALDIYRGYFAGEGGYGQYTLTKTLAELRGSLMGCDLSHLDLSGCQLGGTALGRVGLAANLDGAKLRQKDLFFNGHWNAVDHFDISPDGSKMLTGTEDEIKLWDVQTGSFIEEYWELKDPSSEQFISYGCYPNLYPLEWVRFIDDNTMLVRAGTDRRIQKISLTGEIGPGFFDPRLSIEGIRLSADRTRLVLCAKRRDTQSSEILVLNTEDLQLVFQKAYPKDMDPTAFMTGDDRQLVVCSKKNISQGDDITNLLAFWDIPANSYLQTWDIRTGACVKTLPAEVPLNTKNLIRCNNKLLSIWESFRTAELRVLDLQTGALLKTIPLPNNRSYALLCGRSERIAAVVTGGLVYLYDTADFRLLRVIEQRGSRMFFGPEDKTLALADEYGNLTLYEYPLMRPKLRLTGAGSDNMQSYVTFCGNTGKVAAITDAGELRLWDVATARLVNERSAALMDGAVLESSFDGKYLYYHGKNGSSVYRTADLLRLYNRPGDLCIHPQGKYLAVLQGRDSIILDPEDFHIIHVWRNAGVCALVGELAVVKEYTGAQAKGIQMPAWHSVTLRNVQTNEVCGVFTADPGEHFLSAAVSDRLIAALSKQCLYIWDLHTGRSMLKKVIRQKSDFMVVEFSGDGKLLIVHDGWRNKIGITFCETENFTEVTHKSEEWGRDLFCSPSGKLVIRYHTIGGFIQGHPSNLQVFQADRLGSLEDKPAGAIRTLIVADSAKEAAGIPAMAGSAKEAVISRDDKYLAAIQADLYLGMLEESPDNPNGLLSKTIARIRQVPGLRVMGVDLRKLHPGSDLSGDNLHTLWHYGAMVDLPEKP